MSAKKKNYEILVESETVSVTRSSTSLDELQIELEGDTFPLNELAAISKKDPKR